MVNYLKRFGLVSIIGLSVIVPLLSIFTQTAAAASDTYKFINAKTIGAYSNGSLVRTYTTNSIIQINQDQVNNAGIYFKASTSGSGNGSICYDQIYLLKNTFARVTRTEKSGTCQQSSESSKVVSVDMSDENKFFTGQADGSLKSINGKTMIRMPGDPMVYVENDTSVKCPAMMISSGNTWAIIAGEPKADGSVQFDSEGRTKTYQKYAAAALGQDTYGNCQIGGNDQKSYSRQAAAKLLGGTADQWNTAINTSAGGWISIEPGDTHQDAMPLGRSWNGKFTSWGNPITQYSATAAKPTTNCGVYVNSYLYDACMDGSKNSGADYCANVYLNKSFGPSRPSSKDLNAACITGQMITKNGGPQTPAPTNGGGCSIGNQSGCDQKSSCTVSTVGWIVCPVVNFMAGIVDAAYNWVSSLLVTPPLAIGDTSDPTFNAWSIMRNFANIAFVIIFLIIIFSQITNLGVSNYGVKKMLPKLIVAAVLVNVSYYICAIAVDISNILGVSMNSLFKGLSDVSFANTIEGSATDTGSGWVGIAGFVLAGGVTAGVVFYLGLSILLPALIAALLAIVTVFLVLTLRQALIILLIVVAPLAFVAYLLPNTDGLFKKWKELFQTLLLMYPIIALIFGASAFASQVVMKSSTNIAVQIMGALITILPLAITPVVMKTAGAVLNKFAGSINNPNKGPFDRMRKGSQRIRENQEGKRAIRAMNGGHVFPFSRRKFQRQAKRNAIDQGIKSELGKATNSYVADEIANNESFQNQVAGGSRGAFLGADPAALQRALAGAQLTVDKAVAENIEAEGVTLRDFNLSQLQGVFNQPDAAPERKAAAMKRMIAIGSAGQYETEVNTIMNMDSNPTTNPDGKEAARQASIIQHSLASSLAENGPKWLKASDLDNIGTGALAGKKTNLATIAVTNAEANVLSQEKMADSAGQDIDYIREKVLASGSTEGYKNLHETAVALNANENLNGKIKHNKKAIDELAK